MGKAEFPQSPPTSPLLANCANTQVGNLDAWLDLTCRALTGTRAALIVVAGGEPASLALTNSWPNGPAALHLLALSEQCLATREVSVQEGAGVVTVATPLLAEGELHGAMVVEAAAIQSSAGKIRGAAAIAARYLVQVLLGHSGAGDTGGSAEQQRQGELLALICRPDNFPQTALELVNWVASRFGCSRVALGMTRSGRVRLQAVSHSAWFDRKSQAVTALENAMEESLDQRRSVALPAINGLYSAVAVAHRDAAKGSAACSVVLAGGAGLGAGALYLERSAAHGFTLSEVQELERLGCLIGPVLETKDRAHRWVGGRAVEARRAFLDRLGDPRRPGLRLGLLCGALALGGLTLLDATWRVNANAVVEGEQQRVIAAPFDGFLATASVKAGAVVKKGQTIATLDDRQIRLDIRRWSAEEAQYDSRYQEALSKRDRSAGAMAMAQMHQAQAQRALAEDKLVHTTLTAPFDAFIVSGDLSQHIGSPLEQGKVLFELAPLDAYRVVVKVDERDIRAVKVGQRGILVLSGLTDEKLPFRVKNISVPEPADGRNVFRVEAQLEVARTALRPGMQGVAKIEVGERTVLWIWTHTAWEWLMLQAWKWSP